MGCSALPTAPCGGRPAPLREIGFTTFGPSRFLTDSTSTDDAGHAAETPPATVPFPRPGRSSAEVRTQPMLDQGGRSRARSPRPPPPPPSAPTILTPAPYRLDAAGP